jgi:PIN domain nuclease of toxin-antitoxin system
MLISLNYVTDTYTLVWYFTDDLRLSKKVLEAFEQTTDEGIIIVPSIVLAEIIFVSKKGRITLTFIW